MDNLIALLKTSTVHVQGYKTRLFFGEGSITPEQWCVLSEYDEGYEPRGYDYVGDDLDEALRVFNELERRAFNG